MSDTRLCPQRLGYVHLKVKDLDESLAFWTRAVPLEISARQGSKVYLRGGMQHHWMVLEQSPEPGLGRIALEVENRAELDAFEAHLKVLGIKAQAGDGLDTDRVDRYLRFNDPSGNPLELYCDMVAMPNPPQARTVQLLDIQHVVLAAGDTRAATAFYRDVVGMRESDWVERDVCFLHMKNGWHHGIGVGGFGGAASGLNHICFQPPGLDDVMRARANVRKLGYTITMDLLRHAPSTSVGFYFAGPDTVAEMSFGARHFTEDAPPKPRLLARGLDTIDVWQQGLVDNEQSVIDELRKMAERQQASGGA
ncbi:MAG: VOC family protein [Immundisolibacter sp.]|uniref:VOC family protein n=1 Tax=Immundisolibacter sp. TaxID=1934948 RepID=UPI003EDF3D42